MTANVRFLRNHSAFRRVLTAALVVGLLAAGCSADAEGEVDAALDEAADQVSEAAEDAADAVDEATDEAAAAVDDSQADIEETVDETAEQIDAAAEDSASEIDERTATIAQTLRDNDMESLASAVEQVDATELLGDGEFTFFAPNDEAFLELDADQLADLLSDPAQLVEVLQGHVVTERIDSTALAGMTTVQTRSGSTLDVTVDGGTVTVGGATVVNADIDAADGVIHTIDRVLLP